MPCPLLWTLVRQSVMPCPLLWTLARSSVTSCPLLWTFVRQSVTLCPLLWTLPRVCVCYVLSTFVDTSACVRVLCLVHFCGHLRYASIMNLSTLVDTCGGLLLFVHFSGHGVFVRIIAMWKVLRYQECWCGHIGGFYDKVSALSGIKKRKPVPDKERVSP